MKTIFCTPELELKDLFDAPQGSCVLSVRLGFASDDQTNARADAEDFLVKLPTLNFTAYAYTPGNPSTLAKISPAVQIGAAPVGTATDIFDWLNNNIINAGQWIARPINGHEQVSESALTAQMLIDAAANWPAPLPQRAGILRLMSVDVTAAPDPTNLILVPWVGKEPEADTITKTKVSVDHTPLELELEYPEMPNVVVRCRAPIVYPADPTSLVDETTGFLTPPSEKIEAAVKRLRTKSPSQLWAYPALQSLDAPNSNGAPAFVDWDAKVSNDAEAVEHLNRAIWLGVNGLFALLEPLLMSLPGPNPAGPPPVHKREGPFIAALNAVLESCDGDAVLSGPFLTRDVAIDIGGKLAAALASPATQVPFIVSAFDFARLPAPDNKEQLAKSPKLLSVLLALYSVNTADQITAELFDVPAAEKRFNNSLGRQVFVELGELVSIAMSEAGVESAAKRVLGVLGITEVGLKSFLTTPGADDADAAVKLALARFNDELDQRLNGAEVARISVGSLFEKELVKTARGANRNQPWDETHLKSNLQDSQWFAARFRLDGLPAAGDPLAELASRLPAASPDFLTATTQQKLHQSPSNAPGLFDISLAQVTEEIFADVAARRFKPDTIPQNLGIQVSVDSDVTDGDTFEERFDGFAFLVAREKLGTPANNVTQWQHGTLTHLSTAYKTDEFDGIVVHPLQPVPSDGQRQLFIEYDGELVRDDETPADKRKHPFYTVGIAAPPAAPALSAFSYGFTYAVASHIISKTGTLPRTVRDPNAPDEPWKWDPAPSAPSAAVRTFDYLRTTAIGGVTLEEESPSGMTVKRIGAKIADVVPLAGDYPRLCLSAKNQLPSILDVLRNADGTGAITLPTDNGEHFEVTIPDLWWWGDAGKLTIEVLNDEMARWDDPAVVTLGVQVAAPFAGGRLNLSVESNGTDRTFHLVMKRPGANPAAASRQIPLGAKLGDKAPAWLRVRMETGAADSAAGLSLADPTAAVRTNDSASRDTGNKLLVIAPLEDASKKNRDSQWQAQYAMPVTGVLRFPQVPFKDFERWFANAACRVRAFKTNDSETDTEALKRALPFYVAIKAADQERNKPLPDDEGLIRRKKRQEAYALVDLLPDLAVAALQLRLTAIDGLNGPPADLVGSDGLKPRSELITLKKLCERKATNDPSKPFEKPFKMLGYLTSSWAAKITITCEGKKLILDVSEVNQTEPGQHEWEVIIKVPSGVVARLDVERLVPKHFFGEGTPAQQLPIMDKRFLQLAIGQEADADGHYIFGGTSLTIEGMHSDLSPDDNAWVELARGSIAPAALGAAREYNLVFDGTPLKKHNGWHWRKLASAEIQTQRWRHTGRPIYSWIAPKAGERKGPIAPIAQDLPGLDAFETEAFFDRDVMDGTTQAQQLAPAPAATVLQNFSWELPSATIFRHRVTLRGRYIGALRSPDKGRRRAYAVADPQGAKTSEDWIRVAVLADHTRLQLTRPQVRALIPLTVGPTPGHAQPAPPVLAIIEEPPFAYGGLAERVSAEVPTRPGFGFDSAQTLGIEDMRREAGPQPHRSYRPLAVEVGHKLTFENEGPVGLTFDAPTVPAPVFANTAYLLQLRLARAERAEAGAFERNLVAVGFRRYLDPRWLVDTPQGERHLEKIKASGFSQFPISEPCWLEFAEPLTLSAGERDMLRVTLTGPANSQSWKAEVFRKALDPKGPNDEIAREFAVAEQAFAPHLALLHLPLEEGRASLTLYALPGKARRSTGGASVATGESALPLSLGTVEWHVPDSTSLLKIKGRQPPAYQRISASPMTPIRWTRTEEAFDTLHAFRDSELKRIRVADLRANFESGKLTFMMRDGITKPHLVARMERNPLAVHTHLAVIHTVKVDGLGLAVERYVETRRLIGIEPLVLTGGGPSSSVRVIEFQVPARAIATNTTLSDYKQAVFDLHAIRGDKYEEADPFGGAHFIYRPLGLETTAVNVKTMKFKFSGGVNAVITVTQPQLPQLPNALYTIHFLAVTNPAVANPAVANPAVANVMKCLLVYTDGQVETGESVDCDFAMTSETITVQPEEFKDETGRDVGVFWGDMSMVTVPKTAKLKANDFHYFSWDWAFTGRDLAGGEAATPVQMIKMPEAEDTVIKMTDPIVVSM